MRTASHHVSSDDHVVQFYERDPELLDAVVPYLADGMRAGAAVIVIATEAHRLALEAALAAQGVDVEEEKGRGAFSSLDAASSIAAFATDGAIDREAFRDLIGGLMRRAADSGRSICAYGEMVSLLWEAGNVLGAIELEKLWNELRAELSFSLFCSYRSASPIAARHAGAVEQVCGLHSAILDQGVRRLRDVEGGTRTAMRASFPAEVRSPGAARRRVVQTLRRWQLSEHVIDDAALIVSELASNAVRHAGSPFTVAVWSDESTLSLQVSDRGPLEGPLAGAALDAHPLHGLGVIDAISRAWGVEGTAAGKAVWVELSHPGLPWFASAQAG